MNARLGLLAMSLMVTACTEPNAETTTVDGTEPRNNLGPVIDAVDAPASVEETSSGYAIPIGIRFHDTEGDAVTGVHFRITELGVDLAERVRDSSAEAREIRVVIGIGGGAAPDTYTYVLNLVDARGAEGPPVRQSIALE